MNQYERKNVEQIKKEIRAFEEKNGKMPKEKKHIIFIEEWDKSIHTKSHVSTIQIEE